MFAKIPVMTPKEKAEELLLKYLKMQMHKMFNGWWHKMISKRCALIAVDEILNEYWSHDTKRRDWWKQVKDELEKL
jgi:hypothetical protein